MSQMTGVIAIAAVSIGIFAEPWGPWDCPLTFSLQSAFSNPQPSTLISFAVIGCRLTLFRTYVSSKLQPANNLTVFTTVSPGRLDALEAQCRSWPKGPLVAALYLPLKQTGDSADLSQQSQSGLKHVENLVLQMFSRCGAAAGTAHMQAHTSAQCGAVLSLPLRLAIAPIKEGLRVHPRRP